MTVFFFISDISLADLDLALMYRWVSDNALMSFNNSNPGNTHKQSDHKTLINLTYII